MQKPEQESSSGQYKDPPHSEANAPGSNRYKWLALATVSIGSFMFAQDNTIFSIAVPNLTATFKTEPTVILWLTVVYLLVSTAIMLIVGRLGDIYGRKKIFIIGISLFTAGLILCSISQNIPQLILSRVVQGGGAGMMMSVILAIITAVFPDQERGKAIGILEAVISAGVLAGPVYGGLLLDTLGWRAIFYTRIPVGLIGLIMALAWLKEQKVPGKTVVDYWGAVTLFGCISCLLLFINLIPKTGLSSPGTLALICASLVFFCLFIIQERKHLQPVVDLKLFKIGLFTGANISFGIMNFALAFLIFLTPYYLIDGAGYSALKSGSFIAVSPILSMIIGPLAGWLSDKTGYRLLRPFGLAVIAFSLFLFSRLNEVSGIPPIIIGFIVFGIGIGTFNPTNDSAVMGSVPRDRLGTAGAMTNTIRQIGTSIGTIFAGVIFASRQAAHSAQLAQNNLEPAVQNKLAVIGGYQDALLIAACFCALGIIATLFNGKRQPDSR
jgi:EmrB/QacA subfamily drug resistance transporter